MDLKAWKDICQPKELGSLGFRLAHEMNLALLARLDWKVASNEDSLWIRTLKARYLKGSSIFQHSVGRSASFV